MKEREDSTLWIHMFVLPSTEYCACDGNHMTVIWWLVRIFAIAAGELKSTQHLHKVVQGVCVAKYIAVLASIQHMYKQTMKQQGSTVKAVSR